MWTGRTPVDADCLRRMTTGSFIAGRIDAGYSGRGPRGSGRCGGFPSSIWPRGNSRSTTKTSVSVVFNGEIYNSGLRAELHAKGHRFSTTSDTEILVHLYEEPARNVSNDFAACSPSPSGIGSGRRLFLGRDRLGIKPLYYAETRRDSSSRPS